MKTYQVIISDEEEKALLTDIPIQEWLNNAIHNKARLCIDRIVEEYSDKQPSKISQAERNRIVREAKISPLLSTLEVR